MKKVVAGKIRRYLNAFAANSANGFGDPSNERRTGAHPKIAGAFFVSAILCYGSCARETLRSAGFLSSRFANLRTAASLNRLATVRGSSSTKGTSTMHQARNPSTDRAAAHRAMAMIALKANSSLSVRLKRYQAHMAKARSLDSEGVL